MSLLRHIRLCNAFRPARFLPLYHGDARIGLVRRDDNAEALRRFPEVFEVTAERIRLIAPGDFERVSRAIDVVVERLVEDGLLPKWRNEFFAVAPHWGAPPLFKLDRGAVSFFGVRAYGVHLNGYRREGEEVQLWIGRRAPNKKVAPDKLDNLVAGGIAHQQGLFQTLVKEAEEEASISPALIAHSRPVGALSYRMEVAYGVRDDVLFLYDLETPADFVPRNNDGEIVEYQTMPAQAVLERIRRTDDFKFNVNLVIIDFALRHGLIAADDPEYLDLAVGLRRPFE